jgi:hypothetical protein
MPPTHATAPPNPSFLNSSTPHTLSFPIGYNNVMSSLEEKSKSRKRKADLQRIVLDTIATAGLLSVAALAPNALVAFKKFGLLPGKRHSNSIQAARARLVEKGLLVYEGKQLRLTAAGKKHLQLLALRNYSIPTPARWDKRWRVLIFDIPEPRRKRRTEVRSILVSAGFVRLQDSVWLYPYPCEEMVVMLKSELRLGKEMLYMIVDTLEYDAPYRKLFKLPK